jgi:hypothetical protein
MRRVLQTISWLSLVALMTPPVLFLFQAMPLSGVKWAMLAATVVWFAVTPLWMGRGEQDPPTDAAGSEAASQ